MQTTVTLRYSTHAGENLYLHLTENGVTRLLPMRYVDTQSWSIELSLAPHPHIDYHFSVRDNAHNILREELHSRSFKCPEAMPHATVQIVDQWDQADFPEHFLINKVLKNTRTDISPAATLSPEHSHLFRIKAPLYAPHLRLCLLGNHETLGAWDTERFIALSEISPGVWQTALDLHGAAGELAYKYGYFDANSGLFLGFEGGENRHIIIQQPCDALTIVQDLGYRFGSEQLWRAAGVAIPVFSLRSRQALGSGEFSDLKLLGEWAHQVGLSMIQLLPINDSSVNYSWDDQCPYSAISVYALHPQYLSIRDLPFTLSPEQSTDFLREQQALNACDSIDFERMICSKWRLIRAIARDHRDEIVRDAAFAKFIAEQAFWLKPYAVFCVLRDQYGTVDFTQWGEYASFSSSLCATFFEPAHPLCWEAMLHCWVQYHLHLQLSSSVEYLHELGVSIKGDLPIGVRRHSVDTWVEPQWFGMDFQAGAPPDMFSDLGQNWELPTYEWERMRDDQYGWWRRRMQALAQYFDAMRIDHVLGFFRIWRIPSHATQGLLGYFYPALGITRDELRQRGIDFEPKRDCAPRISASLLAQTFGSATAHIIEQYFQAHPLEAGLYQFKPEFDTQRKIVATNRVDLQAQLLSLHTEVLFIPEQTAHGIVYHPRFNVHQTQAYQVRSKDQQERLYQLYIDYFFVRQETLWRASGLEKLPALQKATDMLICAEDLGLVPECVPQVLDELGIVALKIQRSPKEQIPYYDPKNIDYMNVATTSSHDSSTLRQWWRENPDLTQHYYNEQLQRTGDAPAELSPVLVEQIIRQHLQSPAMLAIFPMQDWLATSATLRRTDENAERINNPANPAQRWSYRMHISLEELLKASSYNRNVANWISLSDR